MKTLQLPGLDELPPAPAGGGRPGPRGRVTDEQLAGVLARARESSALRRKKRDDPVELFEFQCRTYRLPEPRCKINGGELRFATELLSDKGRPRQWRFDFAWPKWKVAVEIEGLVMVRITDPATIRRLRTSIVVLGRHCTPNGIYEDMEKYNAAALLGWLVLRFAQNEIQPGRAIAVTQRVLAARGWKGPR